MKSVIIVYSQIYEFGGLEYLFIQLAKFLKKKKLKLIIICFEDKINFTKYENNIKVIKLSNNQNFLKKAKNLKKTIDQINHKGMVMFCDLKSAVYAKLANIKNYNMNLTDPPSLTEPTVSRLYSKMSWRKKFQYNIKNKIFNKVAKQGIENAKNVITNCKANKKEFKKFYKIKPKIIYQGIQGHFNKRGVSCKPLVYKGELNLVSVCRLHKSKNLDWILYGMKYLLEKNHKNKYFKNINLDIIGSGPELKRLKTISKEINISKKTKFYGQISENKKNKLLSNAHINLISAVQGYGLPALESLKFGVPIVINKESRICEILKNNKIVKITKNNKSDFIENLYNYSENLKNNKISNYKVNHLPTAETWALALSKLCNWL